MHPTQHMPHGAGLIEYLQKRLMHMRIDAQLAIHAPGVVTDQLRQIRMQAHAVALQQQKHAHEFARLILEHRAFHIIDFAIGNPKAIDHLLGAAAHPAANGLLPTGPFHDCQTAFNGAHDQIDIAGVPIVIAHERLQSFRRGTIGVAQLPGDLRLNGLSQRIHRTVELVMQLIAGTQQKRISRLQFLCIRFADLLFGFQILNQPQTAFEVHHPAQVLIITQATAAILYVRLLHGHSIAIFFAAR